MNFLSHHFADAIADEYYYNFGLLLPDMLGSVERGWRMPVASAFPKNEISEKIAEGVNRHLFADAYFHSSAFFKEYTALLKEIFERNGLKIPGVRLYFVAHIFLELMLDRLILQNYKSASPNFYNDISKIDNNALKMFLEAGGVKNSEAFIIFFERFQTLKYINHYIVDESLLFALNRIMQRAAQPVFGDALKQNFVDAVLETEALLSSGFLNIFEELKSK